MSRRRAWRTAVTDSVGNRKARAYLAIVGCAAAIFIATGFDTVISNPRSLDLAYVAYVDFWQTFNGITTP